MKNCLVLGASGFIGKNLCTSLLSRGIDVSGFDLCERPPELSASIAWARGEFISSDGLESALVNKEVVYHLISTSVPASAQNNRVGDVLENLIPTIKLLDLCLRQKVKKIIFISSGGTVYGRSQKIPISEDHPTNPVSAYGVTKLAIEKYIGMYSEVYGIESSLLRLANPYGPYQHGRNNQGVITAFINSVDRGEDIQIWGNGDVIRDYIYIDDVCDALFRAAGNVGKNTTYNIGSGVGHDLMDVIRLIEDISKKKSSLKFLPARSVDVATNVLDIRKARDELSWHPKISLRDGISLTKDWLKQSRLK